MPLELRHVCPLLQVFDMPTSLAFYRDTLGFSIDASSSPGDHADWVQLRLGDAYLMLNTRYEAHDRPATPDPARVAAHDDTGLYFGCPDVDAAYAFLRERGVDARPPTVAPYGMKQLYVTDPDGYALCFQWPHSDR
ncbi:VOC family protein [Tahibacter soli]|uniref:VOC family protein n=1 Tax=Tahibacter soli TaxID=2983605 RepID=A0A9X3YKM9_9GAMM|nr:VOC family protein [Tahibacter soli]MDC8014017.1 VOC family protein [Tahibacter soli]